MIRSLLLVAALGLLATVARAAQPAQDSDFEAQVADYIQKFPYQDTYNYAAKATGGDPAKLNTWAMSLTPTLVKAGEDIVVRTNNDTYYQAAAVLLDDGPVVLTSDAQSGDRFSSFQLIDDRNVNFHNVINPDGAYTLYFGEQPEGVKGEPIESPSRLAIVLVRVEVKDKDDPADTDVAKAIFNGITIDGPSVAEFPELDLLSGFSDDVREAAEARIDEAIATNEFRDLVPEPGDVPDTVSYLQLAAGTKSGWGGPASSHSAYDMTFLDADGDEMHGENGVYTLTTEAPAVEAFWSVTVYDTDRGGFFHPNSDDRYHINNTTAVPNDDGTYTFVFATDCTGQGKNCI
ncbi:MAG: hypothetical protein DRJ50_04245, partial [Actinobacteria bacterium]